MSYNLRRALCRIRPWRLAGAGPSPVSLTVGEFVAVD